MTYGGTGGGRPCVFPFIYKGKSHKSCIMTEEKQEKKKWCSTTDNFDKDQKWGLCPIESEFLIFNFFKVLNNFEKLIDQGGKDIV